MDSNPYSRGGIKKFEHYLEDRGHEDRESRQEEHKDTGDSLLPGFQEGKNTAKTHN